MPGLLFNRNPNFSGHNSGSHPVEEYEDAILRLDRTTWLAYAKPSAWAQYRDSLVKGLRWWNSEEGGVSTTTKGSGPWHTDVQYITGLFIGKHAARNSYLDAEVLIVSQPHHLDQVHEQF